MIVRRSHRTISVVLPNYNHAAELRVSLDAILSQTRPPDEIFVIDDGSTDDSLDIIQTFMAKNTALRLLRHPSRRGVVAAVNAGLNATSADYVILAAADEKLMPDMCEQMEAALDRFPDARLLVSRFTEWLPETGALRHGENEECDLWFLDGQEPVWISPGHFGALLAQRHVRLSVNSAMFSRAALFEVGLFDPALEWHSDWFAIYSTAFRYGFGAIPRTLSWYRVAPNSFSAEGASGSVARQRIVANLHKKLDRPEFDDIRRALARFPSAMAPFMRATIVALFKRPGRYGRLTRIMAWWLREAAHGRRPAALARRVRTKQGQDGSRHAT